MKTTSIRTGSYYQIFKNNLKDCPALVLSIYTFSGKKYVKYNVCGIETSTTLKNFVKLVIKSVKV